MRKAYVLVALSGLAVLLMLMAGLCRSTALAVGACLALVALWTAFGVMPGG